jgi:cell division protein FtsW (lipid II flippase)
MMAFFMLWATAAQTVVTFLGNWRLIPLTGLGTPLLSIGLSSTLVPVIAMTLIMVVKHQSPVGKS